MILALILFGPEKLPEYAAKLGRLVARLKQASSEVTEQIQTSIYHPPTAVQRKELLKETFCHRCGHHLEGTFTFCPGCGRRLQEDTGPAPPPVSRDNTVEG
jgi:rubrerythrin